MLFTFKTSTMMWLSWCEYDVIVYILSNEFKRWYSFELRASQGKQKLLVFVCVVSISLNWQNIMSAFVKNPRFKIHTNIKMKTWKICSLKLITPSH